VGLRPFFFQGVVLFGLNGRNFPDQYGGIATRRSTMRVRIMAIRRNFPDQYGGIATRSTALSAVERFNILGGTSLISTVGLRLLLPPEPSKLVSITGRNFPDQYGGIATIRLQGSARRQNLPGGTSLISTVGLRLLEVDERELELLERGRNFPDQYGGIATQRLVSIAASVSNGGTSLISTWDCDEECRRTPASQD